MIRLLAFSLAATSALLSGQVTPVASSEPRPPRVPTLAALTEPSVDCHDGVWVARGRNYLAEFDGATATYAPFFGTDAPQTYFVRFSWLDSENAAGTLAATSPVRVGDEIHVRRHNCIEVYALAVDHIEQKFVFAERPQRGALAVRLQVDTDLDRVDATSTGLAWSNRFGTVTYGQPVVVDATGRRTAIMIRYVDGHIELEVPESIVAASRFPLTIDPVITNFTRIGPTQQANSPDIAFDVSTGRYVAVWTESFSSQQSDVGSAELDIDGNLIAGSVRAVAFGFQVRHSGSCVANNNRTHKHLIAYSRGGLRLKVRTRDAGTNTVSQEVELGLGSNPDVGGDPIESGASGFLVAWHDNRPNDKKAVLYRFVDPTLTLGPVGTVTNVFAGDNDQEPSISKSNRSPGRNWHLVWERSQSANGQRDIHLALISARGVGVATFAVDTSPISHRRPTVSSPLSDETWLVAYVEGFVSGQTKILARTGTPRGPSPATIDLGALLRQTDVVGDPAVESDGCRFAMCFSRGLGVSRTAKYAGFHLDSAGTLQVTEPTVDLQAQSFAPHLGFSLTSTHNSGGDTTRFAGIWHNRQNGGSIEGALFDMHSRGSGFSTVATGCGGLTIQPTGFPALGQTITYTLGNAGGVVLVGSPIAQPLPLCPPAACRLGVDPIVVLSNPLRLRVPCDLDLVGGTLAMQGVDLGSGGCVGYRVSDTVKTVIR